MTLSSELGTPRISGGQKASGYACLSVVCKAAVEAEGTRNRRLGVLLLRHAVPSLTLAEPASQSSF